MRQYTPENVTSLQPNQVFVFGSNAEGVHGKGAARLAKQKFGAKQGQAEGLQGQSYAVITKKNWRVEKSSTLQEIGKGLQDMLLFAKKHPEKEFLVTKLGSSLAGYTIDEIKGLFNKLATLIPNNVVLPVEYEVRDSQPQQMTLERQGTLPDEESNERPVPDNSERKPGEVGSVENPHKMMMNFADGTGGREMRPEFRGKSTLELIKTGDRTATSRDRTKSYNQQDIKVGDYIIFSNDKGDEVTVQATTEPYPVQRVDAETWSKLEGWTTKLYHDLVKKGYDQFQFKLLDSGTKSTPSGKAQLSLFDTITPDNVDKIINEGLGDGTFTEPCKK